MINTIKIQTALMKLIEKDDLSRVKWQEMDGNVYLTLNGFCAYVIPSHKFYINLERLNGLTVNFRKILQFDGYKIASGFSNFIQSTDNRVLRILENGEVTCYVDEKVIKDFGKDIYFKIKNEHGMVYIYDTITDNLIGIVCPVAIR